MNPYPFRTPFILIALAAVSIMVMSAADVRAQSPEDHVPEIKSLQAGTRIWTGTAGLQRETYYRPGSRGSGKTVQTRLSTQFRYLRLTGQHLGWGVQGMGELFMSGTFGNVGLGTIGLGPLLRGYLWQNQRWHTYIQGGFIAGYDLALGDAIGANRGEGMRYRTGLRAGITYRVNNAFGLYLETGPDWEADEAFQFDSQAWQLNMGIQLFRF